MRHIDGPARVEMAFTMGNQQDREKISTTAAITGHEPVNRCYSDVRVRHHIMPNPHGEMELVAWY
jgi:hypothetical protein